ncbi:MAG: hypothetical protein ABL962_18480 [Fimbriimonadaceae bacterium]
MRGIAFFIGVVMFATTAPTQQPARAANLDIPPIIRSFAQFMRSGRVSGTRRIELGDGAKSVTEYIVKSGELMRTTYSKESPLHGQVIVENRKVRKVFDPIRNEITVTELHPASQDDRLLNFVRRGAKIEVEDGGKIAGRPAQVVSVMDGRGRVQFKLWLDFRTGFPLKKIAYNNLGHVQGSFEFESVNYNPARIELADFDLNIPSAKVVTPVEVSRRIGNAIGLKPVFLPKPQFFLQSCRKQEGPFGDFLVQVYEGEVGRVTLFQSGKEVRFKDRANSPIVVWQKDGQTYALLGQPPVVLQRLARLLGKPD